MLLMNQALLLGLFMIGTFVKKFDLLVKCESNSMQPNDPGPNYEDTREFYSVSSLKKANNESTFIKLVFVVGQDTYNFFDKNSNRVSGYCQEIVMLANSHFQPYNIFIALADIIIWTEKNEFVIDYSNIDETHTRFKSYGQDLFKDNHSIDHVVLLSDYLGFRRTYFTQLKNVSETCQSSIGVIFPYMNITMTAARFIFLFVDGDWRTETNEDIRNCFERMNYISEFESYLSNPTQYKKKHCVDKLMHKMNETKTKLFCLKTKPDILYKKPVCGNNVTEPGEECDCMWVPPDQTDQNLDCDNPCCNAATCRVKKTNYSCAFGECCDLNSCTIKLKKYQICRPIFHQCDAEEYCDGEAAFCPKDKFVHDGGECSVTECRNSFMDDGVVFCQGTTEYKGICNSKGLCQDKKKIPSSFYNFFIHSAVILLGGIILLSVNVCNNYMLEKYRFRFHNQNQQRQTNNSTLRNRTINEPTPVNEDNQRLTETTLDSFEMNSLSHREHEYDELSTQSNIYENPSEIHQKCENNSSDNYGYTTAHSCPSTTGSGHVMPTASNSGDQQNIDNICTITIPKQQAPGYEYENCDKSNNILDPIHDSASSADENHHHITFLRPLSTTSSGYQIPITSNSNDRYHQHIGTW